MHFQVCRKYLSVLLSLIGCGAVLFLLGTAVLGMLRNHPPDSVSELTSPDGRYRIVTTEELAGFPGAFCIKQVYVLRVDDRFDRNDADNEIFVGACDSLNSMAWDGARVVGTVFVDAAVVGVQQLKLKGFGADGKVRVRWNGR